MTGVVAVAASGGRDSTALLHCTARQARSLGLHVLALHVHHGLQPEADAWLAQVRRQARRWGCSFAHQRLQGQPQPGDSVEAWARRGRYAALAHMAQAHGCTLVLLAHHRRDQAETWLLQALRSGGPRGLSAMPRTIERDGITWARPWLDQPREAIEHYLARHRIAHADDPSNADARYARSRARLDLWPALTAAFPHAEAALAGAARRARQAAALAAEAAAADLPSVLADDGGLHVARWAALPPARRRNVLEAWLPAAAPLTLADRLMTELPGARGGARWPLPQGALLLQRGILRITGA
jgi:tRNA(Ile)-lysidine synthase